MIFLRFDAAERGRVSGRMIFSLAGWIVAALMGCLILPRLYHRVTIKFPATQQKIWSESLARKKAELSSATWQDSRPLHILAGDSHIEMGNWYELLGGTMAVRNCGLSMAKISDVAELISAVPDRKVESVVLMCGINNLGRQDSVPSCLDDYAGLLKTTRQFLQPHQMIVLSVLPVRLSLADQRSRQINRQVVALNQQLAELCRRSDVAFVMLTNLVQGVDGGLAEELTGDGLHLNAAGYRRMAAVVRRELAFGRPARVL